MSICTAGRVLRFLDLVGLWDPSLAFVMGGAIAVGIVGSAVANARTHSFPGGALHMPAGRDIDKRLVLGSMMFGVRRTPNMRNRPGSQ